MSVYKRGDRWHYAFCIRGVRYREAIPEARTKYEAEKAETRVRNSIYEGRYGRPSGGHDFLKFAEGVYLPWSKENKRSWYDDELFVKLIRENKLFRGKTFAQISPLLIEKFKKERREGITKKEEKRSPATVNRELEILSSMFTQAIKRKVTDTNPCLEVQKLLVNNKRNRYLLDEEEPLLLAACKGERAHLRSLVIVAIGTGMRKGDQLRLLWSQVDFQRNCIYVPNRKTNKDYMVPMNKDVCGAMVALRRESAGAEHVFVNPKTSKPYTDIKKAFAGVCREAKIIDFHWHDLRHTFGTRLGDAGFSEVTIAELMGHTSVNTTRRYTHGTERAKREAVEAAQVRRAEATCHNPATNENSQLVRLAVNG